MPFDGSGNYVPIGSPDFPAVAATTIRAAQYNNQIYDLATALSNCVTRNGQSPATADLPLGGYKLTDLGAPANRTDSLRGAEVQDGLLTALTTVAGTNTITAEAGLGMDTLVEGQFFQFVPAVTNTGAATLNINAIGATAVTKNGATALAAGDLVAGKAAAVYYDGTQFQLLNPTPAAVADVAPVLQAQTYTAFTTAGTAPAFTVATSPLYGALAANQRFRVKFNADGTTGSNTLNRDTLGVKDLKQYTSAGAKTAAIIVSGMLTDIEYDGTDFVVLNPLPPTVSTTGTLLAGKRQTVVRGPRDTSSGRPNFLPDTATGLSITSQNISTGTTSLVVSAAYGSYDTLAEITSNITWSGLTANSTNYLFIGINDDGTTTNYVSTAAPIYTNGYLPAGGSTQRVFDTMRYYMHVGSAGTNTFVKQVCVGEAVTDSSNVTSTVCYAYNGFCVTDAQSIPGTPENTHFTFNHNLGVLYGVTAAIELVCTSAINGYSVGDVVDDLYTFSSVGSGYTEPFPRIKDRNTLKFSTKDHIAFPLPSFTSNAQFAATSSNFTVRTRHIRNW